MTQLATAGAQAPTTSIFGAQHPVPGEVDPLLVTILAWPRPHESYAEKKFRAWLAAQISAAGAYAVQYREGNLYVPGPEGVTTLFSCHIDTADAHMEGGPVLNGKEKDTHKTKSLTYDANFGTIALDKKSKYGTCLGADDGVGVWLMLKMLKAGVKGGYIFHIGEEKGGLGSMAMSMKEVKELSRYKAAVAFDRPHCDEVIIHQRGSECASVTYGAALAKALNTHGFAYDASTKGAFTDTANYRKIIPECTNIGVGYEKQHGIQESLDYAHAYALAKAVCLVDWQTLPIARDNTKPDYVAPPAAKWKGSDDLFGRAWDAPRRNMKDYDFDRPVKKPAPAYAPPAYEPLRDMLDGTMTKDDMYCLINDEPDSTLDLMMDLTVEVARLRAEVMVWRQLAGRGTV